MGFAWGQDHAEHSGRVEEPAVVPEGSLAAPVPESAEAPRREFVLGGLVEVAVRPDDVHASRNGLAAIAIDDRDLEHASIAVGDAGWPAWLLPSRRRMDAILGALARGRLLADERVVRFQDAYRAESAHKKKRGEARPHGTQD